MPVTAGRCDGEPKGKQAMSKGAIERVLNPKERKPYLME
jgi:hypothetical protein